MGDAVLRTIAVVTTARSDYGILRPVLRAIAAEPSLRLRLLVGGMHLSPEFGSTVDEIERDGFTAADRVELLLSSDTPLGTAKSIALAVLGFAESYARERPDIVLVLGDRFEMHAAALAALPFGIPIAHIHGGEVTEGAIDDALRHGITKIAHLHFAATEQYADRIVRLGEEPWRVTVSGAPSLDNLRGFTPLSQHELASEIGFDPARPQLLVTFHPVTRELQHLPAQSAALLGALRRADADVIFTMPNADPGGRAIVRAIEEFVTASDGHARMVSNLGTQAYFSLMTIAVAMVGNSSSGLIEAASFGLPVVNVGSRQNGRIRARNVIDVRDDEDAGAILKAIRRATSPEFRSPLSAMTNPYGSGDAAAAIVARLRDVELDERLLQKRFHEAGRS